MVKTSYRREEAGLYFNLTTTFASSKFINDVSQTNFQRFCYPQKDINRRNSKASFNLAHINRIYVNLFRQFFLRQTRILSVFADTFAEKFSIFFCDHDWPLSQAGKPKLSQILLAIIFILAFLRKIIKGVHRWVGYGRSEAGDCIHLND